MAESFLISGVQVLRDIGFFNFFLPFLLFFAIIYGALEKTKVFGDNRHDINSIIALVISLIASTTAWVIEGITGFLPWVGFVSLVIVCFLMLVAMVYGDVEKLAKSDYVKVGAVIAIVVTLFAVLYYTLGFNKSVGGIGMSDTDIALIVMIVIGIGAFVAIIKGGGSSK